MFIYYKYAPDRTKIVDLYYDYDCVYWYTSEALGKWFVDNIGNIFHVKFLGYTHWFMSIRISHMKDHSISVDQARYSTSIVAKYLDTVTVKTSKTFYKTSFPSDIIFTKDDPSNNDEKVEKLTSQFNSHHRACIGSLIYLLYSIVDLSFAVHKLAKFLSNSGKLHFEGLVHLLKYI